jgi:hypothetical protein
VLLARELQADVLLVLTDVAAVSAGWGTPTARATRSAPPGDIRRTAPDHLERPSTWARSAEAQLHRGRRSHDEVADDRGGGTRPVRR